MADRDLPDLLQRGLQWTDPGPDESGRGLAQHPDKE